MPAQPGAGHGRRCRLPADGGGHGRLGGRPDGREPTATALAAEKAQREQAESDVHAGAGGAEPCTTASPRLAWSSPPRRPPTRGSTCRRSRRCRRRRCRCWRTCCAPTSRLPARAATSPVCKPRRPRPTTASATSASAWAGSSTPPAAYRTAIDLYARLLADAAEDATRIKLARACNELGRTLRVAAADRTRPPDARAAIEADRSAGRLADRPECRYELARSYYTLGRRDMLSLGAAAPGPRRPAGPRRREGWPPGRGGSGPIALLEELVHEYPERSRVSPPARVLLPRPAAAAVRRDEAAPGRPRRGPGGRACCGNWWRTSRASPTTGSTCARRWTARPAGTGRREGAEQATGSSSGWRKRSRCPRSWPRSTQRARVRRRPRRYLDRLGLDAGASGQLDEAEKLHRKAVRSR